MKKFNLVVWSFLLFSMFIFSCGQRNEQPVDSAQEKKDMMEALDKVGSVIDKVKGEDSDSDAKNEEANSDEDGKKKKGSSDKCDKFLSDYEEFMTSYVSFLKKYEKNPNDPFLIADYAKMTAKMSKFEDENPDDCENDPAFAAKYAKISMKVAEAGR